MVSDAVYDPDVALTVTFAIPEALLSQLSAKSRIFSSGHEKVTFCEDRPSILIGPSISTLTFTSAISPSIANRLTGIFTLSPHERILGRVGISINGERTIISFSALPYAPCWAATTMTLTEPTYIGRVIL